jgi:hypothetical protein
MVARRPSSVASAASRLGVGRRSPRALAISQRLLAFSHVSAVLAGTHRNLTAAPVPAAVAA